MVCIKKILPDEEKEMVSEALKLKLTLHGDFVLFGCYVNNEIVSIAGVEEKSRTLVLKFSYTKPTFRKKGYGAMLLKHRLLYCKENYNKKIVSSCMPMSLNLHLSEGAKIIKHCKDGGAMIYYESL